MKSISKKMMVRLAAQAEEAKIQGLTKTSDNLCSVLTFDNRVRKDDESHVYSCESLNSDVECNIWNALIRTADFFDCNLDINKLNSFVKKISETLQEEVRVQAGVSGKLGAHEPPVLGEEKQK